MNINSKLITSLGTNDNKISNYNLNALPDTEGTLSNIEDLSKFAITQLDSKNKELELTRQTTFEIPKYNIGVGLAWKIIKPDSKHTWYMYNVGNEGYYSIIALDILNKNRTIILSNISAFNKNARNINQLCLELMKPQY
ncbi:hypothetical protein [Tenacibaculum sp. SDUM215027]|uniref:hypothetical protein n=1 Tax=Tenacibaculum sp. SDUM215027 TaxID=3422596 RepID=UPI003D31CA8B